MKLKKQYDQLQRAVENQSEVECKKLLDAKIKVNHPLGKRIFQYACRRGFLKIVKLFIEAKANINFNNQFGPPLHLAIGANSVIVVALLIQNKADVDIDFTGKTPLVHACNKISLPIVQCLLSANPKPNINDTCTDMKMTALHVACLHGALNIAEALINAKADVFKKDKDGLTPLRTAIRAGNPHLMPLLVEKKADINQHDSEGVSLLHHAIFESDISIIKRLVEHKADIDKFDNRLRTPLDWARASNNKPAIKYLKSLGAQSAVIISEEKMQLHMGVDKLYKDLSLSTKNITKIPSTKKELFNKAQTTAFQLRQLEGEINFNLLQNAQFLPPELKFLEKINQQPVVQKLSSMEQTIKQLHNDAENKVMDSILNPIKQNQEILKTEKKAQFLDASFKGSADCLQNTTQELASFRRECKSLNLPEHLLTLQKQLEDLEISILQRQAIIPKKITADTEYSINDFQKQVETYQQHFLKYKQLVLRWQEKEEKQTPEPSYTKPKKAKKILKKNLKPKIKRPKPTKLVATSPKKTTSVLVSVPTLPQSSKIGQKINISINIRAAKLLLNKLEITSLATMSFESLNTVKYTLIRILLNIVVNQSQIVHHPKLRNLRNTLHNMSLIGAEINPHIVEIPQLHKEVQELAGALSEFIGLYQKSTAGQWFLPTEALWHFSSPLLNRLAGNHLDTRSIADEKFQELLRQSARQAKSYWIQVMDLLSQPCINSFQSSLLSTRERNLTLTFAMLCQILEAYKAGHTSICIGPGNHIVINNSVLAIAREWRHRGISLEKAEERLQQFTQPILPQP